MKKKSKINHVSNKDNDLTSEQDESLIIDELDEKIKNEKSLKKKLELIRQANLQLNTKSRLAAICEATHKLQILFTGCCDRYKKTKQHCIPPCGRIMLPQEIMSDPHKAAIYVIHVNFDSIKFNSPGEELEKEERFSVWLPDCDKGFEDKLKYYKKYSKSTLKDFVGAMEKKIIQDVNPFIDQLPNSDGDSRAKIIMGMTQQQLLFKEIRNALNQNKLEYMAELMFYAGRLYERINSVLPYETLTVEGAVARKSHTTGANEGNRKHLDLWPKVVEEWRKIKDNDEMKIITKYLEIAEKVYKEPLVKIFKNPSTASDKKFVEERRKKYSGLRDDAIIERLLRNKHYTVRNILKREGEIL